MKRLILASVAVASMTINADAAPISGFTGFAGFGDSLSDKGRQPDRGIPFDGGRFSNGPTWMEIVGEEFENRNLGNVNLALGGATAGDSNTNDPAYLAVDTFLPPDPSDPDDIALFDLGTFDRQITAFQNRSFGDQLGDNPLVGLLFGGNDFFQNGDDPTFNPVDVAADIVDGVRTLAQSDAKFDDFLVLNLPDLAPIPGNAGLTDLERFGITQAVQLFNTALDTQMAQLALDEGITIEVFDLFTANSVLAQELGAQGIDLTTPCVSDGVSICASIEEADDFFFIDTVHPNRLVQAGIADGVLPFVQAGLTPVPVPAGMPLLVAGIGAFAAARLIGRKKAA